MNNEMQRKYLTSIKRLMRFAQVRLQIGEWFDGWWMDWLTDEKEADNH